MVAKTLFALVVLTATVMATPIDIQDCRTMVGVKDFTVRNFCGKPYYVFYTTYPQGLTCTANQATCNSDGTVTIIATVYINGVVNTTVRSIASDDGPGVVLRTYPDNPSTRPTTQVVLSYSEYASELFKASYLLCKEDNPLPFRKSIIANFINPDLTNELNIMKPIPTQRGSLEMLPNECFKQ